MGASGAETRPAAQRVTQIRLWRMSNILHMPLHPRQNRAMTTLDEIGTAVRVRRVEMGLTQQALAKLSGLSRSTVNAVERQSIGNLSVAKAQGLLEAIGLSLGVIADASRPSAQSKIPSSRSALARAATTASVSYAPALTAAQLEAALMSGEADERIWPHLRALLDEAQVSLLARVVDELSVEKGLERAYVWSQMRNLARALLCFRGIWQ